MQAVCFGFPNYVIFFNFGSYEAAHWELCSSQPEAGSAVTAHPVLKEHEQGGPSSCSELVYALRAVVNCLKVRPR